MDKVFEELGEAKPEIEELNADLRDKTDSLENLKKSHDVQVNQILEARFKIEKLDQELLLKADEITGAKQMNEDLKGNLNNEGSIIKHISTANENLRVDCDEKFKEWEDEKRGLVLALEKANEIAENQEQEIHLHRQEIEILKGYLSISNKKCLEIEDKSEAANEIRERDDMFQKLEEVNRKVEEQLKWKKEQLKNLEEAHEKLRDQFRSSEQQWELEKVTLLDNIASLQISLDSQIRISEDLQRQLEMCNQTLAHEESRRRSLEVQLSDFKVRFDTPSSEYEDARSQLDCLNFQQDRDVEDSRWSLKTKEAYLKELERQIEKLEQENHELKMSIKGLKEAQIQEAGDSFSQWKLQSKDRNLEQICEECSSTFKAKEAELSLQIEKLTWDLNGCRSELATRTAAAEELKMKLEGSHSTTIELKVLNEELSVMLLVLKQGISEAQLKLADDKGKMDLINREREEKCIPQMKQLEVKNAALISSQEEINEEEREKETCLMRKVDSFEFPKEQQHSPQSELDRYKEILEESTKCQLLLKEKLGEAYDALDRANIELDERICEGNELEFELQIWKSTFERLKNDYKENHVMLKEMEASLLAQVEFGERLEQEKDSLVYELEERKRRIDYLQQQVRETEASDPETGRVRFLQIIEEKEKILEKLQKEVVWLEQESFRREFESAVVVKSTMERTNELERENFMQLMNEKKRRMDEILQQVSSLEQQFTISLTCFSSQLAEKQAEINMVQEACDKIKAAEILAALEIEEKKLMILELEDDIHDMQQKLKMQEEIWANQNNLQWTLKQKWMQNR